MHARLFLLLLLLAAGPPAWPGWAVQLDLEGPIGPATHGYVERGLQKAREEGAQLVVLRMDTPGGLAESMREIILDILASPVPVVTFVSPSGARAASAGTYLLYASHIAAMAPATHVGAATPVSLGGGFPGGPDESPDQEGKGETRGNAMEKKAVNDAVAYIQGLARLRGRNAEWAEKAVRDAASIDADEALRLKVINLIAADLPQLLSAIDGREIRLEQRTVRLDTTGMTVVRYEPDWRTRLLAVLTDPNVAYLLLLLGIYGLIFEFSNPGAVLPGVAGAIALMLALFALQILPINYAGLALILLGVAMMVGEAFVPSFGALGIGGAIALAIGSLMLIDTEVPGFGIDPGLIAGVVLTSLLLFVFVMGMLLKARKRPVVSGAEQLIGMEAIATEAFEREGQVRVHGEIWHALATRPVARSARVRVIGINGLMLTVEPIEGGN